MIDVEFFQRVGEAATAWFPDDLFSIEPVVQARTNESFIIYIGERRYVLQALNTLANPDGTTLMAAQAAIFEALQDCAGFDYDLPVPIPGPTGETLLEYADRQWRLANYVEQTEVVRNRPSCEQAQAAGQAYGALACASLLPGLPETNGTLFNVEAQWRLLEQACANAEDNPRLTECTSLREGLARHYPDYLSRPPNDKPTLVHGDARLENLLFTRIDKAERDLQAWVSETSAPDKAGNSVGAMLDFDQTGIGQWWWDFGSLAAQIAINAENRFDETKYAAMAQGFLGAGIATAAGNKDSVIAQAANAPAYMTCIRCIRLLADYLTGDRRFRVPSPDFNLDAAHAEYSALEALADPINQQQQRTILRELVGETVS